VSDGSVRVRSIHSPRFYFIMSPSKRKMNGKANVGEASHVKAARSRAAQAGAGDDATSAPVVAADLQRASATSGARFASHFAAS
jgi:hypothetical protein